MAGAFLLWLSNNFVHDIPMTPVDALFIATSAVCVTGLSVIDVSKETGVVSQLVLLSLIQIGGSAS
ncbi:hypothetical protein [uncultured Cloacibacillus sp.]|uniref:hypothetical protein n=1 Tax=uncultured Cloacibacillus sp. TaxID=889794 RepID=UPI00320A4E98